jgi:hypothetical protein
MFDTLGDPFDAGPYADAQVRLRLGRPCERVWERAAIGVLIAWAPLVALYVIQQRIEAGYISLGELLRAFDLHARYLVAVPLLVLAEPWCLPQLSRIARHLEKANIISEGDWPRYAGALDTTRRLLRSRAVSIALLVLAYAVTFTRASTVATGQIPIDVGRGHRALAEWWRLLISQPLFLLLFESWLWRIFLWTRLLVIVSRLHLAVLASHPDRAGGLGFLRTSLWAFAPLATALGVIVAGTIARQLIDHGRSLAEFRGLVVTLVVVVLVLFAGPLLVLFPTLKAARTRSLFEYGDLVADLGRQFEEKWLTRASSRNGAPLMAPDFSAMIDLSSIVANVYAFAAIMVDVASVTPLVAAALLPLVPLAIFWIPFDRILELAERLFL